MAGSYSSPGRRRCAILDLSFLRNGDKPIGRAVGSRLPSWLAGKPHEHERHRAAAPSPVQNPGIGQPMREEYSRTATVID